MCLLLADWSTWTAAIMTSSDVRDQIISAVVKYASDGQNSTPLSDLYDTNSGKQATSSFFARPVVGGHLALVSAGHHDYTESSHVSGCNLSSSPCRRPPTSRIPAVRLEVRLEVALLQRAARLLRRLSRALSLFGVMRAAQSSSPCLVL